MPFNKTSQMELIIIIITVLAIFFSAVLPHSASLQLPLMRPSLQHQENALELSLRPITRKLRFTEQEVKEHGARDLAAHKKEKENLSGQQEHQRKEIMVVGKKGTTRPERAEGDDPSQYFTMDYRGVRRRRPIHNKYIHDAP